MADYWRHHFSLQERFAMTTPDLRERAEAVYVRLVLVDANADIAALVAFAQAVQEDTREECAGIAEDCELFTANWLIPEDRPVPFGKQIAAAIRQREEQP
jgi:hypothetical protein